MVIGYTNDRVREDNTGRERAMGTQGLGCANNNGERLSDLCVESRLVIGGALFMHRDIHKTAWRPPDQRTVSQIDHVIINQKRRRSLQDVKANRGADIGSDHVLVVATVSLKLRKTKRGEERQQRFDTANSAEMLKAGGAVITETLTEMFKEIWEGEEIPSTGRSGVSLNCQRKKPKPLHKLERGHITVHHQQSIQQSDPKQNIYSPRPNATQRTGRIQERKILRRTHIYMHPTTDSRTMPGMENTVLCKLHRL